MDIVTDFTYYGEFLSNAYYIAGIVVVVGVFAILKQNRLLKDQLVVMKSDSEDRRLSESFSKSLELLNYFVTKPLTMERQYADRVRKLINSKQIDHSSWCELNKINDPRTRIDYINPKTFSNTEELNPVYKLDYNIRIEAGVHELLNELEYFSAALIQGYSLKIYYLVLVQRLFVNL